MGARIIAALMGEPGSLPGSLLALAGLVVGFLDLIMIGIIHD